ncbi:MAG: peptide-methionine (S)-S-oxide reductase MsrA [Erysipelotrichales bacterium]|nr:MAG: peptide-methionine (S)-S-oxide reductase MsrA [Erysipelotrichales bacterium]
MKKIVVAGGCFWGVEEYFRRLNGTYGTRVGYAQGTTELPDYKNVCSGRTLHAEVVEITYEERLLNLEKILEHLFRIIDPTSLNRQGNDAGTQYRVGVYPETKEDYEIAQNYVNLRQRDYAKPLVFEVEYLKKFWEAETYHQEYLVHNPGGYCHVDMHKIKPDELKVELRK